MTKKFTIMCNKCKSFAIEIEPICRTQYWDDGAKAHCTNCGEEEALGEGVSL